MLLSHKTDIQLNTTESNIVGHMCYAASKLWNVCNYERRNFKELGMVHYPDWYDQKARLKGNMWFKSLPSQTAQEVCKLVDKSWKSFYTLIKSKGIQNPKPPRFKQSGMTITYMQNAIVHVSGSKRVRLSLPKQLKEYLKHTYDICDNYLYLENKIFQNTDVINPKPSKHMLKVYKKKRNCIHDYLHKVTRAVVNYCKANDIHTVIIGDITNIRRNKNLGKVTNQKLHALPYAKIYGMLEYKLAMHGITLAKQTEEYSSQCSPHAPQVTKEYAKKCNRTSRGLYKDQLSVYNADAVGAYNIMRKYFARCGKEKKISVAGLSSPLIIKVAV